MNHDDKFLTSTPKKTKFECEECENKSQCTDCFVGQTLASSCDWSGRDDLAPVRAAAGRFLEEYSPLNICAKCDYFIISHSTV